MGDRHWQRDGPTTRETAAAVNTRCLLHDKVNDYDEALRQLTSKHYAPDVLAESEREGSTDNKIKKESGRPTCGFVEKHPTLERICLSSGATTDKFKFTLRAASGAGCLRVLDEVSQEDLWEARANGEAHGDRQEEAD